MMLLNLLLGVFSQDNHDRAIRRPPYQACLLTHTAGSCLLLGSDTLGAGHSPGSASGAAVMWPLSQPFPETHRQGKRRSKLQCHLNAEIEIIFGLLNRPAPVVE